MSEEEKVEQDQMDAVCDQPSGDSQEDQQDGQKMEMPFGPMVRSSSRVFTDSRDKACPSLSFAKSILKS